MKVTTRVVGPWQQVPDQQGVSVVTTRRVMSRPETDAPSETRSAGDRRTVAGPPDPLLDAGRLATVAYGDGPENDGPENTLSRDRVPLAATTDAGLPRLADEHGVSLDAVFLVAWAVAQSRYDFSRELAVLHERADGTLTRIVVSADERLSVGVALRQVETALGNSSAVSLPSSDESLPAACTVVSRSSDRPDDDHAVPAQLRTPITLIVESGTWPVGSVLVHWLPRGALRRRLAAVLGHVLAQLASGTVGVLGDIVLSTGRGAQSAIGSATTPAETSEHQPLLHQLFERHAATRPDAVAVVQHGMSISYEALDRQADRWARRLRAAGAQPEVLVGVHLARTPELVSALLGILKAGACYLPLDVDYPRERLELMADDSALRILVSDEDDLTLRTRLPLTVLRPSHGGRAATASPVRSAARPDNPAYVLYTSGSTGRPKGALLTHRNAADLVSRVGESFGDDLDRVLAATSICFDCSIIEIFATLGHGGTVVLAETAMDIGTRSEGQGVRLLHTVPSVVDELLRADHLPMSIRTVIVGGERLSSAVVERIYANSSIERLVNTYGPMECATYVTLTEVRDGTLGSPPIGRPASTARIHLLDPAAQPVPLGFPGEVYVAGPMVSRGYLHRPAMTAERFLPDPFGDVPGNRLYRTGDLAYGDDHGELFFFGRVDDQMKVRGVRVEPSEIEDVLCRHPGVAEAAVAGSTRRLTAFVVTPKPVDVAEVRAFVADRLPRPMRPDSYEVLDRLPRMPNGKVDRRRLAVLAPSQSVPCAAASELAAPRSRLETMLVTLWAAALERDTFGIHDNVFDLGGHSLTVLSVRAQLCTALGHDVPVRMFFDHPTLAELAEVVQRAQPGAAPRFPRQVTTVCRRGLEPAPLSVNQRAILSRVRTSPDDPGLVFPLFVRLQGRTAAHALASACSQLLGRHDSLRTTIVAGADEPMQQAQAPGSHQLPLVDLGGLGTAEAEEMAARLVARFISRPFAISAQPLSRFVLVRLGSDSHVFGVTTHHLVSDAWSIETLSHQLVGLYSASLHGRPATTAESALQYADCAVAQLDWLVSEAGHAQLTFWRRELDGLPTLGVPGDRERNAVPGHARQLSFHIGADLTGRVGNLARRADATRFMVFYSAFAVLLGRRSGQSDFAIGCPTSGRDRPELASVIGPCHDAFVLRVDLSGGRTFRELLRRVRERAIEAYSQRELPFAVLAAELGGAGSEHPLFQAAMGFQERPSLLNYPYSRQLLAREPVGDLEISGFSEVPLPPTALDIELALAVDPDGEIEGVLTCRSDVVDDEELHRLAATYCAILDAATARPHTPITGL